MSLVILSQLINHIKANFRCFDYDTKFLYVTFFTFLLYFIYKEIK